MTCIVGLVHEGKVYIGGDSAGVAGYYLMLRADQKVFTNGPFVMGFTSSFRMGQLLRWAFRPPDHDPRESDEKFMAVTFINEVRKCLKEGGWASKENDQESGGTFLVGYKGRLYHIADDYQVGETPYGFDAVGCGQDFALGALHVLEGQDVDPEEKVRTALLAAERFSAGVASPFTILEG